MVFHVPSRRTDAFSASRDFSAARVALRPTFLEQPERGIEHQEGSNDGSLDIFAEHQFEKDRRFEHPRKGRPELFERHSEGVHARIGHCVWAKSLQSAAGLIARQAAVGVARRTSSISPPLPGWTVVVAVARLI